DSVSHYILSPQSEIGDTRRFLAEHGFKILREDMLEDMGKYYLVWDVVRGSMDPQQDYEYQYGKLLIEAAHPVLRAWLEEQLSQTWMLVEKLREAGTGKSRERIRELEEERDQMRKALNALNKASGQADGGFC
ncbi:MAG: tRNA (adenine(22)-N(1))-methyltransferase TrmK, partial [Lachnospiraceae bacterium]